MLLHKLIGRQVSTEQIDVENKQSEHQNIDDQDTKTVEAESANYPDDYSFVKLLQAFQLIIILLYAWCELKDRPNGLSKCKRKGHIQHPNVAEKMKVIAIPNASTQPQAVVIETMHAIIASVTMYWARRAKYLARLAEFQRLREVWHSIKIALVHHEVKIRLLCLGELVCEVVIRSIFCFLWLWAYVHAW